MTIWLAYIIALLLGAAIGVSELLSRYRDAPFRAVVTLPAIAYVVTNGLASIGALAVVREMGWLEEDGAANQLLVQALAAGLSAMALFRTSLFTIRVGGSDIGIGPAAFLQILLQATDRACDRARAEPRAVAVREIMAGISFEKAKLALPSLCFGLMQNVSTEEQATFSTVVARLESAEMDDGFKANSLGLSLMNVVGEQVLRVAVGMLRSDIKAFPKPIVQSIETLGMLIRTRYGDAARIVDGCLLLSGKFTDAQLTADMAAGQKKIAEMPVTDQKKVYYLSALLIGVFGEAVVQRILGTIAEGAAVPPAAGGGAADTAPEPPIAEPANDAADVVPAAQAGG